MSWRSRILSRIVGLARKSEDSLDRLDQQGIQIGNDTYASLLRDCTNTKNLVEGQRIHTHMIESGHNVDRFLGNLLVEMYGKCGSVEDASRTFEAMQRKNVFSWNIMIGAYAQNGYSIEALELFKEMVQQQVEPSNVTFVSILSACSDLSNLAEGKAIHALILKSEFDSQTIVGNALVNMYGKCSSLDDARQVFDRMPCKNVVSWNAMISAYAQNGHGREALELYSTMDPEGIKPNRVTFLNALDACPIEGALAEGRAIHARIVESGLDSDVPLGNTLINMYAKCGSLDEARIVFEKPLPRNAVSWTAMITAYAQHGNGKQSLQLYREMDLDGVLPDKITFISVLDACSSIKALREGEAIHELVAFYGYESDVVVGTALVKMYGECGKLDDARGVFDNMSNRNLVSWNTMITAYAQHGHSKEALQLYQLMDMEGEKPNEVTLVSALEACASVSDLAQGREIHAYALATGLDSVIVGSALVNLYDKCGSLKDARNVFESMIQRDVVSWTAMVSAYSHQGCGPQALALFEEMNHEGMIPNAITFVSVLFACSHSGLLQIAHAHFISMSLDYEITPVADHYDCIIDVLSRAGKLDYAEQLINCMPFQPGAVVWMSLLAASKVHGDVDRGARAAKAVFDLDPTNCAPYTVLSGIYAAAGRADDLIKLEKSMEDRGLKTGRLRQHAEVRARAS